MAGPTSYQRVTTATDYDTVGQKFFLDFDGVDDGIGTATFAAGTLTSDMDLFMAVRRDSTATGIIFHGQDGDRFVGCIDSVDASNPSYNTAGAPSIFVDGAPVGTTRAALHNALTPGEWHVLELHGLDLSTWTVLRQADYGSGYTLNAGTGEFVLAPAQSPEERTKARESLAAKYGVTL